MRHANRVSMAIVFILVVSICSPVIAKEDGKFNSSNGCSCHTSNTPATTPTHNFPSTYTPNQSYSISIGFSGGVTGYDGGFSLEVSQGTLSTGISIGSVKINSAGNQATHTTPDYRSWGLYWEAPSTGSGNIIFELAVLSANGNGNKNGDSWGIISPFTSTEITTNNTPPEANSLSFIPINPTKMTGLSINYTFFDSDGDIEQNTEINWKLNDIDISEVDNSTSLPNSLITKGDYWKVTIIPSDGIDLGENISLGPILIGNSPPSVTNFFTLPENPDDSDEISLSYNFSDLDGDDEEGTSIHWYLDELRQNEIDNFTSIPSIMIRPGDIWQVSITPNDGQDFGQVIWSNEIIIGTSNTPPTIIISPFYYDYYTNIDIQASINFSDIDNDEIQDLEIKWFQNGVQVYSLNNLQIVPSTLTQKGENWNFSARASDGLTWSGWTSSDNVIIINSLPSINSANIIPNKEITTVDNFHASWIYYDEDQDEESNSTLRWFIHGVLMPEYDGLKTINSSFTERGQIWSFQVTPKDGVNQGLLLESPSILIKNAAPESPQIYLENGNEGSLNLMNELNSTDNKNVFSQYNLIAKIGYYDPDDSILNIDIQWSRNGFHVPELDNLTFVSSERLEPGQTWSILVEITDPLGLSNFSIISISISNNHPEARISYSPETIIPGVPIMLDASKSFDLDGTINSWLWTIDDYQINGQNINLLLETGEYLVQLSVTDNLGSHNTTYETIIIEDILIVDSIIASLDESDINLEWAWKGSPTEFNIYRSTSPILSLFEDHQSKKLTPIATTSESKWSEKVPIGTTLYYSITTYYDGEEVIWIGENGTNIISINASNASNFDSSKSFDSSTLSIPLSILLIMMGILSILLNVFKRGKRI